MQLTDGFRQKFLAALADGATVRAAAVDESTRRRLYELRDNDSEFAKAWARAADEGTDLLEEEAQRRAVEGVEDFRVGREGAIIPIRRYSDTLLIFLLKARRPERFRDNVKVEHTGRDGGPVQVEHRGVKLTDVIRVAREAGVEPGD